MFATVICKDCASHAHSAFPKDLYQTIDQLAEQNKKTVFKSSCMGKCSDGKISTLLLNSNVTNEFEVKELTAEALLAVLNS